jgi:hypothetical protein
MPRASEPSVEEAERIFLTKRLTAFYESDDPYLELPASLSTKARAFCHALCTKFGLFSKSKGKGDERFITISKAFSDSAIYTPEISVSDAQMGLLRSQPALTAHPQAAHD